MLHVLGSVAQKSLRNLIKESATVILTVVNISTVAWTMPISAWLTSSPRVKESVVLLTPSLSLEVATVSAMMAVIRG